MKIQFGAQSIIQEGSLVLSSSTSLVVQKMNIISKQNCKITLSNYQLNIFSSSTVTAKITKLLVNLSFAQSSGNITLISNINGILNISGYQIMGDYNSTSTVALIGINLNAASVNVNQISFQPNVFNVGNGSSYLFGSAVSTQSTIMINNLSIIMGNNSNYQVLCSISTSNPSTIYYLFGGVIANINSSSIVTIENVILDCYQQFNTNFVSNFGILVGYVQSISATVTVKNVCMQQNMTGTDISFNNYGFIGNTNGNTSLQNVFYTQSVEGSLRIFEFGIIGAQQYDSLYAEVINLTTSMKKVNDNTSMIIGSVFGVQAAKNCSIQNITVLGGNISGYAFIGGFIGQLNSQNIVILSSSICNLNISGQGNIGGIIGYQSPNSNSLFQNISISDTNVSSFSNSYVGGFIGQQYSNVTIIDSSISKVNIQDVSIYNVSASGGFIGCQNSNANSMILNSQISDLNISGANQVGGIIGCSGNLYLTDTKIQTVRISSLNSKFGIVVGNSEGVYSITSSLTTSNFINGVLQRDCPFLANTWSIVGCV
ncbi:S-layer_homology domain-containing protein [Hexamita inflata]|uniref:S-layer homology domain-containing protein n=1 Tax=Hexamita inflata TaxID=28002 RepID=A0AA86TL41_9EUKA|nr:S-layer homology domain-containing protein [Hexamita inflata]